MKELFKYDLMGKEDISEDKLRQKKNWKLRPVVDLLRKISVGRTVSEMPIASRMEQQEKMDSQIDDNTRVCN